MSGLKLTAGAAGLTILVCKLTATLSPAGWKIIDLLIGTKERIRVRTPAGKVHVIPVAIPGLIHHHLVLENGKATGLGIEELVGDACQLWLVHEHDCTAS